MVELDELDGRLVRLLPEWRVAPVPLYVVYPPNRHLSNKLRVFVDWTVSLFAAPISGLSSPLA